MRRAAGSPWTNRSLGRYSVDVARAAEGDPVEQLDRRGVGLEDRGDGLEGAARLSKWATPRAVRAGRSTRPSVTLRDEPEGPLAPAEEVRDVPGHRGRGAVRGGSLRRAASGPGCRGGHVEAARVRARRGRGRGRPPCPPVGSCSRHPAASRSPKRDGRAVREHGLYLADVIHHRAVADRVRARRVRADHPPERGSGSRRPGPARPSSRAPRARGSARRGRCRARR
jgi:hypothetical protein